MTDFQKPEEQMMKLLKRMSALPMTAPPKESPISMPQAALLNRVARSPGCGVLDIAKGLNLTPPTVSVGIRRLIKDGWLEQRTDPHDRRSRPLYLTEKGENFVGKMKNHRTKMLKLFLSGLSSEEQEQLVCLLDRAVGALEKARFQESI
jgi:DNA-binding MarR family transcriptional regulator